MSAERIMLIGGSGYVGSEVCRQLSNNNMSFCIVDNFQASLISKQQCEHQAWQYHSVDIRDESPLLEAVQQYEPTHIVNLAAIHYIPDCNRMPQQTLDTNISGLLHIITAAQQLPKMPRIIVMSSAAVYDGVTGQAKEIDKLVPADIYGISKYYNELLAQTMLDNYAVVRLFNVFGNHDLHQHLIPKLYQQGVINKAVIKLGNGTAKRDFVHVSDVARAVITLLHYQGSEKVFNIGSGNAHSVGDIVRAIEQTFQTALHVNYNHTSQLRPHDKPHLQADISKIQRELSWKPEYNLVDGLRTLW